MSWQMPYYIKGKKAQTIGHILEVTVILQVTTERHTKLSVASTQAMQNYC